jgi:hypothetical protein
MLLLNRLGERNHLELPMLERGPEAVEKKILASRDSMVEARVPLPDLQLFYHRQIITDALTLVPAFMSSAKYGYDLVENPRQTPPSNSDDAITRNIGLCGNHASLFKELLETLGLRTRTVQFWWTDDMGGQQNHIAVEVFFHDAWRLYDPTFGAYFVDGTNADAEPLSTNEARAKNFRPIVDVRNKNYRDYELAEVDPFAYLRRDNVDTTISYNGVIHAHLFGREILETHFENIPNFIGHSREDNHDAASDGISFAFPEARGRFRVSIEIGAVVGCVNSSFRIGNTIVAVGQATIDVTDISDPMSLKMEGHEEGCYAVLNSIRFVRVSQNDRSAPAVVKIDDAGTVK